MTLRRPFAALACGLAGCLLPPDRDLSLADAQGSVDARVTVDAAVALDSTPPSTPGDAFATDATRPTDGPRADALDRADVLDPTDLGAGVPPDATPPNADVGSPVVSGYVRLAPAVFEMGSPLGEGGRVDARETQHTVTLTRAFYLKATEVTQGEWRAVMNTAPARFAACGDTCPVEQVSWNEAVDYCNALSAAEGRDPCYDLERRFIGRGCPGYRLPTEAEWEYAARAGTVTAFPAGPITVTGEVCTPADPNLAPIGWYCANAENTTHPVATRAANPWGLFDLHGNVNEWVHDNFDEGFGNRAADAVDPLGGANPAERVVRGGSWLVYANAARSAFRSRAAPETRNDRIGFRTARWE